MRPRFRFGDLGMDSWSERWRYLATHLAHRLAYSVVLGVPRPQLETLARRQRAAHKRAWAAHRREW